MQQWGARRPRNSPGAQPQEAQAPQNFLGWTSGSWGSTSNAWGSALRTAGGGYNTENQSARRSSTAEWGSRYQAQPAGSGRQGRASDAWGGSNWGGPWPAQSPHGRRARPDYTASGPRDEAAHPWRPWGPRPSNANAMANVHMDPRDATVLVRQPWGPAASIVNGNRDPREATAPLWQPRGPDRQLVNANRGPREATVLVRQPRGPDGRLTNDRDHHAPAPPAEQQRGITGQYGGTQGQARHMDGEYRSHPESRSQQGHRRPQVQFSARAPSPAEREEANGHPEDENPPTPPDAEAEEGGHDWLSQLNEELQQAIAGMASEKRARGTEAHARAKAEGRIIQPHAERAEAGDAALKALLGVMSTEAILRACKIDLGTLQREQIAGEDLAKHLRQLMQGWSEENMCKRVTALIRFQNWLATEAPNLTLDDEISTVTMQRYFNWVHSNAGQQHDLGKRARDGTRAGKGAWEAIKFFEQNWGYRFQAQSCGPSLKWLHERTGTSQPRKDARAFSPGIVACLLVFVARPDADPILRHIAAVLLIMAYTGMRYKNAQNTILCGTRDDQVPTAPGMEVVFGQTYEKNPRKHQHEQRQPIWIVLADLACSGRPPVFMEAWRESVADLLQICESSREPLAFLARTVQQPPGRYGGQRAELTNGAMSYQQFANRMGRVLVAACGFTPELAKTFKPHSARHFLENVFTARNESGQRRGLAGAWSGWASTGDRDACTWAPDVLAHAAARRLARMPDRYARHALAQSSISTLANNLEAVRKHIERQGGPRPTLQREIFSHDGLADVLYFHEIEKRGADEQ